MLDNDIRCSNILDDDMGEPQTTGNLKAIAKRSGLSGVQIAEQMGIDPKQYPALEWQANIASRMPRYSNPGTHPEDIFSSAACVRVESCLGVVYNWGQTISAVFSWATNSTIHAAYFPWMVYKKKQRSVLLTRPMEKRYTRSICW